MTSIQTLSQPLKIGRAAVAGTAAVVGAIVWTHALAAVFRAPDAPLAALPLTLAAIAATVVGVIAWTRTQPVFGTLIAAVAGGTGAVIVQVIGPGAGAAALALPLIAATMAWLGRRLAERLPDDLDAPLERGNRE